ncbi:SufD family Fe-S cluster assembly protein [Limosilactobacillus caviae]|uniref:SufD family Fe-S cluster assembly protein n=1 Tax=Limosilactobacillus caviae TaxID=1769424 RepID=A0ABQ2C799_9LACO|nr:SufD family Fe-S cluster assembly protein [Limosilactobacillus caviae]MCD7123841.1 SufD family Fe-S cluster assembly protein [Limosilactobacillus caviae]MRH46701.1 hypothetical protein [Limosilactobacillus reuteri]GGI63614.1 hypothetical protein GCM10011459_14480 [Limosilactobacillus caviae]
MEKIWQIEPAWLTKKRQLAVLLQSRFPSFPHQDIWNKQASRQDREPLDNNYLFINKKYLTALLQENLMEKAVFWQDNQLNANHLANIDSGQFMYLHSQGETEKPVVFSPHLKSTDSHNVIIISAGVNAVIEERMINSTLLPSYEATEILVGANAHVTYRQANQSTSKNVYRAIHAYQAHGSTLNFEVASQAHGAATVDLYSFLDGQKSQWNTTIALTGGQRLIALVDGFGQGTSATLTQYRNEKTIVGAPFKVKAGEPLAISEDIYQLKELANKDSWLNRVMTAK